MIRDFVTGILWGGVVAGAGLGVASQLAPLNRLDMAAPGAAEIAPMAEVEGAGTGVAKAEAAEGAVASQGSVTTGSPPVEMTQPLPEAEAVAGDALTKPEMQVAPEMKAAAGDALMAPVVEAAPVDPAKIAPDLAALPAPKVPVVEVPVTEVPVTAVPTTEVPVTEVPAAELPASPTPDAPAGQELAPVSEDAASVPPESDTMPTGAAPVETVPEAAAQPDTATVVPAPAPATEGSAEMAVVPAPAAENAPQLQTAVPFAPAGSLAEKAVEGVTQGRLPSIGTKAAAPASGAEAATAPLATSLPPVERFAQPFENTGAKPLFAVLLIDPGTDDIKRAELADLPFPVTFVIDPMAPNAAESAALYRAAGQEVLMLATAIPQGATASDLEQSFVKLNEVLPEAVALIDTADATFQNNRGLAAEVVTLLAAQGRGVVTFDRGLNAADQVAQREDVPSATIFRSLDDDGEDAPLIRRYLDRAAFKAAQEGSVVVIGTARDATVAALMEWAVEGRAATVALAPITAVMAMK